MIVESYEDVVVLSGSLRSNVWETIHTAISLTLRRHPTGVVIDCSGLTDATPEGAETFRDAMKFISGFDARVIVAAVPAEVLKVLRTVSEVRSQLPVADSVAEARRSLDLLVGAQNPRKRLATPAVQNLLVILTGEKFDRGAQRITSQIADSFPSEIHGAYVVLVPRDVPLQSPLPQQEEKAAAALEHAREFFVGRNLAFTPHLERGRDLGATVAEIANSVRASHVIVPISSGEQDTDATAKIVKSILAGVRTDAIFVRGA